MKQYITLFLKKMSPSDWGGVITRALLIINMISNLYIKGKNHFYYHAIINTLLLYTKRSRNTVKIQFLFIFFNLVKICN
jgi:hypothetical protein